MASRGLFLLLIITGAACADDLPSYQRVVDLRLLAMRADPPEVLQDGPAPIDMSFSALVLDPRGGPVDYTWSFCPVESGRACANYDDIAEDIAENPREELRNLKPALDAMRTNLAERTKTALPLNEVVTPPDDDFAERGTWRYALDDYAITAPAELFEYHLQASALGGGMGAWPAAVLHLERGGEELLTTKRMVIGLQDLRFGAALLVSQWGYTVCPTNEQEPGCILIRDRTVNTNPVFTGVQIAQGEDAHDAVYEDIAIGPDSQVAGPIGVRANEAIRIRPLIEQNEQPDAGDRAVHPEYHYQSIRLDIETEELFVDDRIEEVSISWFVTGGSVADPLTWPLFTKSLDTVWRAPHDPPADTNGRITVWMVARDQRGGVAWMSVEILVLPVGG